MHSTSEYDDSTPNTKKHNLLSNEKDKLNEIFSIRKEAESKLLIEMKNKITDCGEENC